jgi:hypothetical protein
MKKAIGAIAIIGAFFIGTGASAQTQAPQFKNIGNAVVANESTDVSPGTISETDVNIRAVRTFRKGYPNAGKIAWNEASGNYFVNFINDGIRHKIAFNKSGQTEYSLKLYTAKQVPAAVVKTMKLSYYDYEVKGAQELVIGARKVQVVQLAGLKSWKTIRIADGEVEEIQNLREL